MFAPSELFDLRHTSHKDIFHDIEFAWEALPKIKQYLHDYIQPNDHSIKKGNVYIEGPVQIGEGTVLEPNVVIYGPVIIGKDCHIRSGAYIRGNCIIGDRVIIGNSTEVKNSILFNEVAIPHFNYVGDSILGYKAHLGAGVILSNTKIPMTEIKVQTLEKIYKTGLKKFGALIGDEAEIGCNAVLNPGSIVETGCMIYPGTIFRGVAQKNTIVKNLQAQEIVLKIKNND